MAEENDLERTEPATPQRLQKARDEGHSGQSDQAANGEIANECHV